MSDEGEDLVHLYRTDEKFHCELHEGLRQAKAGEVFELDEDCHWLDPTGKLPPALIKALYDPFDYALGLRDGQVIRFSEARLQRGGKWIHLFGVDEDEGSSAGPIEMSGVNHHFPRGIDIRLSDIMWVADAPDGS